MGSDTRFELRLDDNLYPACLKELQNPPQVIYGRGDPAVLSAPSLSIVGSRRATPYGMAIAEMAARVGVESKLAIVSGGARGCDSAAGLMCLECDGVNVVVLGTGADVCYPSTSAKLIDRTISSCGAVISIEPWGTPPQRWAFPKRNKVIAALSSALVVSEAGMPSGTFSTAETAMALGREVLVAPGSILSPESRGSNYLISVGCCCLTDIEALEIALSRVYGTLRLKSRPGDSPRGSEGSRDKIMELIVANPMRADEIAQSLRLSGIECLRRLSNLENAHLIERLFDGRYAPTKRALHDLVSLGDN